MLSVEEVTAQISVGSRSTVVFLINKAKAIRAELLELNLNNKLEETGK